MQQYFLLVLALAGVDAFTQTSRHESGSALDAEITKLREKLVHDDMDDVVAQDEERLDDLEAEREMNVMEPHGKKSEDVVDDVTNLEKLKVREQPAFYHLVDTEVLQDRAEYDAEKMNNWFLRQRSSDLNEAMQDADDSNEENLMSYLDAQEEQESEIEDRKEAAAKKGSKFIQLTHRHHHRKHHKHHRHHHAQKQVVKADKSTESLANQEEEVAVEQAQEMITSEVTEVKALRKFMDDQRRDDKKQEEQTSKFVAGMRMARGEEEEAKAAFEDQQNLLAEKLKRMKDLDRSLHTEMQFAEQM